MRVAFSLIGGKGWTGGSHYLLNLLGVLKEVSQGSVESILFAGNDRQKEAEETRHVVNEIILSSSFTEWSFPWFVRQVARKLTDRDVVAEHLFRKAKVDVVFHSGLFGNGFDLPCVNWIPDFQHLRLPGMFSPKERRFRDKWIAMILSQSDRLILSSESALHDLRSFFPVNTLPIDILRFVVRIPEEIYAENPQNTVAGYDIPDKFIFLPSQFWKHKNHAVVIDAIDILHRRGRDIFLVCSGNEQDHRYPGYADSLKLAVKERGISDNIAFLGLIPIDHVYQFIRQSIAVLNPSLFEGWSTTVEEAKSIGKRIILSDIAVHREQNPDKGLFFDPSSPADLAARLAEVWEEAHPGPDLMMEERARAIIGDRVNAFGRTFIDILAKTL